MVVASIIAIGFMAVGCMVLRANINEYMFIRHMNKVQQQRKHIEALRAFRVEGEY